MGDGAPPTHGFLLQTSSGLRQGMGDGGAAVVCSVCVFPLFFIDLDRKKRVWTDGERRFARVRRHPLCSLLSVSRSLRPPLRRPHQQRARDCIDVKAVLCYLQTLKVCWCVCCVLFLFSERSRRNDHSTSCSDRRMHTRERRSSLFVWAPLFMEPRSRGCASMALKAWECSVLLWLPPYLF